MFRRIPWQDVCKFLAGAFFVNAGILFYLYLARVSVPILGTTLRRHLRSVARAPYAHAVLFFTFFHLGFQRKWKSRSVQRTATTLRQLLRPRSGRASENLGYNPPQAFEGASWRTN